MLPAMFGSSVAQVSILVDTLIASFLVAGSISWLYYSERLIEFPLGVFGVALGTVILPRLSEQHATSSPERFSATLDWALRLVLVIACPAAIGLAVLAGPLLDDVLPRRRVHRPRRVDGGRERARLRAGPRRVHPRQGARARLFCEAGYAHAGADRGAGFVARNGAEGGLRADARRLRARRPRTPESPPRPRARGCSMPRSCCAACSKPASIGRARAGASLLSPPRARTR